MEVKLTSHAIPHSEDFGALVLNMLTRRGVRCVPHWFPGLTKCGIRSKLQLS
jgi:hypothetical protein